MKVGKKKNIGKKKKETAREMTQRPFQKTARRGTNDFSRRPPGKGPKHL